jgi:hypothetical protein
MPVAAGTLPWLGRARAALWRHVVRLGMQGRDMDLRSDGAVVPVYSGAVREEDGRRPPAPDLGPLGLIWAYGWLS